MCTKIHFNLISVLSFVTFFFGLGHTGSFAQTCDCDHILDTRNSTLIQIFEGSDFDYKPGDTFCLLGGESAGLRFNNFVGTEAEPLVFINCDGQVIIEESTYSGVTFNGSQFIHMTGTGSEDHYGFFVKKTSEGGGLGFLVGGLSSDFEIDHFEIANTGFAGIMAKTDPDCSDPATWRRNGYVLRNLEIHHNFIHDTTGEGMYIGFTGGYSVVSNRTCDGAGFVFGHLLENVNIHHNRLENTGWDGIQVNLTAKDAQIHHNEIIGYGLENKTFQNSGMSLGASAFLVYNNLIHQTHSGSIDDSGMTVISAFSGSQFFNNVIIDCKGNGIFMHNRSPFDDPKLGYYFMHNTVIRPGKPGLFYNGTITQSENESDVGDLQLSADIRFDNNLVVDPGVDFTTSNFWKKNNESFIDFITPETRDIAQLNNNHYSRDIEGLKLGSDFRIASQSSPLYNAGGNIPFFAPTIDYKNAPRILDGLPDVGAFEFDVINGLFDNDIKQVVVYPNPVGDKVSLSGVGENDFWVVRNVLGQTVLEGIGKNLNFSNLNSGTYLLQVKDQMIRLLKK